jgi:hypothetical protein
VATDRKSVKQAFRDYLEARRPGEIDDTVWQELREALSPVSESYLRELVRATGLPFAQPWAGVRQHTLEELEHSLQDLLAVYEKAIEGGDRERARYCRRQVIAAKDRARFIAGNPGTPPEKQELKREMVEWLLVWLENPPVFPAWVKQRREAAGLGGAT